MRIQSDKLKPKTVISTLRRLFTYFDKDRHYFIVIIMLVLTSTALSLWGSYMIRPIINSLVDGSMTTSNLVHRLLVMICVLALSVVASYLQSRLMLEIGQRAVKRIRTALFNKLQTLPVRYYDQSSHGDTMSRFTNDVDNIDEMFSDTLVQLIIGAVTIIGTFALMIYTNLWLAMVTLAIFPLIIFAVKKITNQSRVHYKAQQDVLGKLNGLIEERVTGQKVVKVFGHEEESVNDFEYINQDLRGKSTFAIFYGGIMGPIVGNIGQLNYVLTAIIGGLFCVFRGFDIGGLAIFANYAKQFARPLSEVSEQMNIIYSAIAGAERVFKILDEEDEPNDGPDSIELAEVKGKVVLDHVTFGYEPGKTILHDISLFANPGQKIAFVGTTGAGKTTITNLLNRFYEIEDGVITIDEINIDQMKRDQLRSNIAMVLQDTHLFTGTVRENIRYGRLEATDMEVELAAKVANAHGFIKHLEHGYDTVLDGDGSNLSQGQRQLLNIARVAISRAPILVLDEATSSVDTRTERHIEEAMDRLMENRTTFVIAHRLSTVRNADAIMVLEHGVIIERGDHGDLMRQKGRYYKLYQGMSNKGESIDDLKIS